MPANPDKKRIEAHLDTETDEEYGEEAEWREWSKKKLTENLIKWFMRIPKKERRKIILTDTEK